MSRVKLFGSILASTTLLVCIVFYRKKLRHLVGKEKRDKYMFELLKDFHLDYNPLAEEHKKELFHQLHEMKSDTPPGSCIRILEIGSGSGANLMYYPECRLIAVDPNPLYEAVLNKNVSETRGITLEKYIKNGAEDLSDVETGSVDAVVSTLVLCSVQDMKKVLKEVHRVLAPGGRFLYMEHIRDPDWSKLLLIQKLMTYTGYWAFYLDCSVHRDPGYDLEKSKLFSAINQRRLRMNPEAFWVLSPHLIGTATK